MTISARLHELHEILTAFRDHDTPGALVIGCTDHEMLYLVQQLEQLDVESPADRIVTLAAPYTNSDEYTNLIADQLMGARSCASPVPATRLLTIMDDLVASLPDGDHRILLSIVPAQIHDSDCYARLLSDLIICPLPARVRLVVRDDHHRLFQIAAESPSENLLAYHFQLPAELVVDTTLAVASDSARPSGERAQALLQLATRSYGYHFYEDALELCKLATIISNDPTLTAYSIALQADILHAAGQPYDAIITACTGLQAAADVGAAPLVYNIAMRLGELLREVGHPDKAASCFTLAEHAADGNMDAQALARQNVLALTQEAQC